MIIQTLLIFLNQFRQTAFHWLLKTTAILSCHSNYRRFAISWGHATAIVRNDRMSYKPTLLIHLFELFKLKKTLLLIELQRFETKYSDYQKPYPYDLFKYTVLGILFYHQMKTNSRFAGFIFTLSGERWKTINRSAINKYLWN